MSRVKLMTRAVIICIILFRNIAAGCGTDVFCQASYKLQQEVAVRITIPEADEVPIYKDYLRAFGYNVNDPIGNSLIILADLKIPNGCMCGPL